MKTSPRGQALRLANNKPDMKEFTLEAIDRAVGGFQKFLDRAVSEAITLAMADEQTTVRWPAEWGDSDGTRLKRRVDPLTIYLSIALADQDHPPEYSFNLRAALSETIGDCREDGSFGDGLARIMEALRELADEIEIALPSHK